MVIIVLDIIFIFDFYNFKSGSFLYRWRGSRANWKCKSFFGNYTGQVKFMKSFFSCKNLFFWQGRKFFYRNTLHMVLKSILFCIFIKYSKKIFRGRKYLKGEHTSSVWLCVTLLLGWRGKFLEGENICAQGFFSFAQGEKKFVKNEGEIVRVRNTLHLGSEPLLHVLNSHDFLWASLFFLFKHQSSTDT